MAGIGGRIATTRGGRGWPALAPLLLLLCAVPIAQAAAASEWISGPARVVDGDTLRIGAETIRIEGIDAPESAQKCQDAKGREWACGEAATRRLRQLAGRGPVRCRAPNRDAYGRLIGTCEAGGHDFGAVLVREGLAFAFVKYSTTYVAQERQAREEGRGVFAAANVAPWDFRAGRWGEALADKDRACPIKGNVGRSGERIYHMPWQRDYARVRIEPGRGERWFCDEAEASRAGWRKAAR